MESRDLEFKSELNRKEWNKWMKTLVAFSNTKGGSLKVFYDDNGNFIGIKADKNADVEKRYITQMIRTHTSPILDYDINEIYNDDKSMVAFEILVKHRKNVVTWLTFGQEDNPRVYIRDEGNTVYPSVDEIQTMLSNANNYEFDKTITGETAKLSDFEILAEEYRQSNDNKSLSEKVLKSLNLITDENKLTIAGLLFVDNSEYKNANLVCTVWPEITKGTNNYIDSKNYKGSILSLIYGAINYVKNVSYYRFGGLKNGMKREDSFSFTTIVLREALVNAFAHRDYKIDGNEVSLDCFPDRIEVSSPGSMIQNGYSNNVQKLESVSSHRRNQAICDVFVTCRLMDRKGSGFEKIIDDYNGLSDEYYPLFRATRSTFTLIIKNKKYQYSNAKIKNQIFSFAKNDPLLLTTQEIISNNPTLDTFISAIKNNPEIGYDDLAKETNLSRDGVKYNIKKLKEAGIIKKTSPRGKYQIVDDAERPCSIYSVDNDIRVSIIKWIVKKDYYNIDASKLYEEYLIENNNSISYAQFIGAVLLAKYNPVTLDLQLFAKG